MWAVTGHTTTIIAELRKITGSPMQPILTIPLSGELRLADPACGFLLPNDCRYFVLAAGVLNGKKTAEQSGDEIAACLNVNLVNVIRLCELILATVDDARICVVGSESGWKGSYDELYAASKAGVHQYVKTRYGLGPRQQLVAVAPPIIVDAGMTQRRPDLVKLMRSKRKMTTALHVAQTIRRLLQETDQKNEVVSL